MKTLCFIGTTLTSGIGDRDALGWCGRLNRQLMRERKTVMHFNAGVPNQTLPELSKRAERDCRMRLEAVEDAMIFFEPGHDDLAILSNSKRRTDATTFEAHLAMTLEQLAAIAPTVLVGPTPVIESETSHPCPTNGEMVRYSNTGIAAVSRRMATLCEGSGIPFLDLYTPLSKVPAYAASIEEANGVCPSSNGHKLIADHAHPFVNELLESLDG